MASHNTRTKKETRCNKTKLYARLDVPEIKLCGDCWLQSLGFELGTRVTVPSMQNLLIIRPTE